MPDSALGMQETVATELAHSLSCGLMLIDDVVMERLRWMVVEDYPGLGSKMDSPKLRTASLTEHLIRLADDGLLTVVWWW